jgi:SAM-dependent methyltransferase
MGSTPIQRLNWGSGREGAPGWINSDRRAGPGIDLVCDIRDGLPLGDESLDYATSVHALQEVAYEELVPVLEELRRVLKPGGTLRLILPDLDKAIQAYLRSDPGYFLVPDEVAQGLGGKLITHVLWYGHSRVLFTHDFIEELLVKAGFRLVVRCRPRETSSRHPEIVALDNRERESLFVEGVK